MEKVILVEVERRVGTPLGEDSSGRRKRNLTSTLARSKLHAVFAAESKEGWRDVSSGQADLNFDAGK